MPTKTRARAGWVATIAALLVLASAAPAWAVAQGDAPVTWAVAPADESGPDGRATVESSLDPGTTVTEHLAVRNLSDSVQTFTLISADGYYTQTGRFNMLPASEPSVAAGTWITIEPSVTVPAGETAVVPFTIDVPANATPGDHTAGVAASVRTVAADADGTQIGVDSRVGFRVSTRVTGELTPAVAIGAVEARYAPSWNLFAPGRVTVTYTATNEGNTTLALRDTVAGTASEHGSLLPGESRELAVEGIEAWPLGLLFVDLTVDGAVPDAELSAAPFAHTLVIWAIPWLYLLAALGVVLILFAILTGRRRNKRRLERLLDDAREAGRRDAKETVLMP